MQVIAKLYKYLVVAGKNPCFSIEIFLRWVCKTYPAICIYIHVYIAYTYVYMYKNKWML